jgi:FAD/FMN-containing dehydrogenase
MSVTAQLLRPGSVDALRQAFAEAHAARRPVASVDLSALAQVVAFSPEDMTVTVQAGITVAALQAALASAGQWLPLDPPHADSLTVADLLHHDVSGPRRFAHGTVREHVLGLAFVTGDGRLIRSGGHVVKNVAGYDLAKLVIGDGGSLGAIVEATFKLSPRPATERLFTWSSMSLDEAGAQIEAVLAGPTEPVLVDLHNLGPHQLDVAHGAIAPWSVVVAFAGHADDVQWQVSQLDEAWRPIEALEYEWRFWEGRSVETVHRTSVLPSRLLAHIQTLAPCALVARAGNGVVYTDLRPPVTAPRALTPLERRLKATYDPHDILPALR